MVENVDLLNEGFLPEKKGQFVFFHGAKNIIKPWVYPWYQNMSSLSGLRCPLLYDVVHDIRVVKSSISSGSNLEKSLFMSTQSRYV